MCSEPDFKTVNYTVINKYLLIVIFEHQCGKHWTLKCELSHGHFSQGSHSLIRDTDDWNNMRNSRRHSSGTIKRLIKSQLILNFI